MENKWLSGKGILFIALFSIAVLIADQVKFSAVWGAPNQYFTLFQFIGPIAGGFIGAIAGTVSVLFAELISFFYLGKEFNFLNLIRLTPMLFATYYFAKFGSKKAIRGNYAILAPLAAILLFIAHPIGGEAWYFSMFWLIPIIAALYFEKNLAARSLGATFTAHSIGSVVWLYTMPTTAAFWAALVPIVMFERMVFAAGIGVSFVSFNTLLSKLEQKIPSSSFIGIDRRYVISGKPAPMKIRR
ncbi:MAG: hypothetical protein V1835_05780 [Candidatus Micrarchaeota archaeon]